MDFGEELGFEKKNKERIGFEPHIYANHMPTLTHHMKGLGIPNYILIKK